MRDQPGYSIPKTRERRAKWSRPIREYFEATARARLSYESLARQLDPTLFVDRP